MTTDLLVAGCDNAAAVYAVTHWHYSKTMPRAPLVRYGVWEHGKFIGCVLFGRGASNNLGKPYGLDQTGACELVRVALTTHEHPVSQIVARSIRALREGSPGMRMVVSFADPNEGHLGGIYQAGNWLYLGKMPLQRYWRDCHGDLHHSRLVKKQGWTTQFGKVKRTLTPDQATPVMFEGKHRYAYPLDRQMRRKLAPLAQPYPSGPSVDGDTLASPVRNPGSTPGDRSTEFTKDDEP